MIAKNISESFRQYFVLAIGFAIVIPKIHIIQYCFPKFQRNIKAVPVSQWWPVYPCLQTWQMPDSMWHSWQLASGHGKLQFDPYYPFGVHPRKFKILLKITKLIKDVLPIFNADISVMCVKSIHFEIYSCRKVMITSNITSIINIHLY